MFFKGAAPPAMKLLFAFGDKGGFFEKLPPLTPQKTFV